MSPPAAIPFLFQFGHFERELTSSPRTAVYQHPAAVGARALLDDVEADPHPDQVSVGVGLNSSEALEELTVILRLDPKPVIEDADAPGVASLGEADVDPPRRARPEADGMVAQFADRQVQPVGIAVDHGVGSVEAELNRQVGKAALLIFDHRLEGAAPRCRFV